MGSPMPEKNRPLLLRPVGKDYLWGGSRLNDDFEKNIIAEALKKYGSTYKAADALQMSQSQLMRKKKKYHL